MISICSTIEPYLDRPIRRYSQCLALLFNYPKNNSFRLMSWVNLFTEQLKYADFLQLFCFTLISLSGNNKTYLAVLE